MELTIISDTHAQHDQLGELSGEVLIHCGDMLNMFSDWPDEDLASINSWFQRLDFELILCVGGNHDAELQQRLEFFPRPFDSAVYLEGTEHLHRGVKFFGAPWVPDLYGQAFFCEGDELAQKWEDIPTDVDVLITHTPPAGVLDKSRRGLQLGCQHLARALESCSPRVHCFGHVHASGGLLERDGTTYVNAAMVNSRYELTREPYRVDI